MAGGAMRENSRACPFCKGSGRCASCNGKVTRLADRGWLRRKRILVCKACEGTGSCQLCHGKGSVQSRE